MTRFPDKNSVQNGSFDPKNAAVKPHDTAL
jgi:hypothetical protein